MTNKAFLTAVFIIALLGLILRLYKYDQAPPINEAFDEVHYAWGGASWIREGTPKSWSNYKSYKNIEYLQKYGIDWRIVSPLIEKPPLYFLLSGLVTVLSSQQTFNVTHSAIRILPILLSFATTILVALFASAIFGKKIGILAQLLYAATPTIVLANRLSVTENLLTPLTLLTLILLGNTKKEKVISVLHVSLISFLAILTKQIGIAIALCASVNYFISKKYKNIVPVLFFSALAFLVYFAIAAFYDLELFIKLQNDVRVGHTLSSLPETIANIFRFPTIGPKNHPFIEGTILLGYILLFASPLWLKNEKENNLILFLTFPFIYLLLLSVGESGAGPFTFFGWYLYPLLPFATILVAKAIYDFWKKPSLMIAIILSLIIGLSSVRFLFLNLPREFHYLWQYMYIAVFLLITSTVFSKKKISKLISISLFVIFLAINILTIINLPSIYNDVAVNDKSLEGF